MHEPSTLRPLPRPGQTVDRYEVVADLTHGGMAAILVVRRIGAGGFDRLLAMKVLLPHLGSERRFVDMFLDEARIAAQIHHRHVVQVFDVGEHDGLPFLAMELLRGRTLRQLLARARALPRGVALSILAQTADGLAAAHETTGADGAALGIVHRDVTPKNVHVGYDGQVKLIDFGIAACAGRLTQTHSGELKGTLGYLAPEQILRKAQVDARADIWAFGVVAWEMLVGRRLFQTDEEGTTLWNVMNEPVERIEAHVPDLARGAARAIMACLERDPDRRPSSMREVADVLEQGAREAGDGTERDVASYVTELFAEEKVVEDERMTVVARPPSHAEPPDGPSDASEVQLRQRDSRRRSRPVTMFAVVAVAVGIAAWLAWTPSVRPERSRRARTPPPASASTPLPPRRAAVEVEPAAPVVTTVARPATEPERPDARSRARRRVRSAPRRQHATEPAPPPSDPEATPRRFLPNPY